LVEAVQEDQVGAKEHQTEPTVFLVVLQQLVEAEAAAGDIHLVVEL
jgi:hypothetical protein